MTHIIERSDIPEAAIDDCSMPGRAADPHVAHWVAQLGFTVPADAARAWLRGFGAWDAADLADDDANLRRVFWLACGEFRDGADCVWLEA